MTRRRGITLIEALVALFIAALGMISLLTLFPLGALQMGQALKDGRCAQSAQEADGLMRWYWAKYETSSNTLLQSALDRGDPVTAGATLPPVVAPLTGYETTPSYPVLVDPLGKLTNWPAPATPVAPASINQQNCVALLPYFARMSVYPYAGSPTRPVSFHPSLPPGTSPSDAFRFAMLQDDLTYSDTKSGRPRTPANVNEQNVERGGRYTWAWLLQRPNNSRRGLINMSVVVFDQRAPLYANDMTETLYPVQWTPGSSTVVVNYSPRPRPPISKGRWVMDVTPRSADFGIPPAQQTQLNHANFYRVASVTDEVGRLLVEFETTYRRADGRTGNLNGGSLLVLNGVAEVFERPPLVTGGN